MEVVFYSASCHALDEHWSGVIMGPRKPTMDEIRYVVFRDFILPRWARKEITIDPRHLGGDQPLVTINSIIHTSFPVIIK